MQRHGHGGARWDKGGEVRRATRLVTAYREQGRSTRRNIWLGFHLSPLGACVEECCSVCSAMPHCPLAHRPTLSLPPSRHICRAVKKNCSPHPPKKKKKSPFRSVSFEFCSFTFFAIFILLFTSVLDQIASNLLRIIHTFSHQELHNKLETVQSQLVLFVRLSSLAAALTCMGCFKVGESACEVMQRWSHALVTLGNVACFPENQNFSQSTGSSVIFHT